MRKPWTAWLAVPVAAGCVLAAAAGCGAPAARPAAARLAAAGSPVSGSAAAGAQARLRLPSPTGRFHVGTVSLHLIDRSRTNPWTASPTYRELMVSIWYPARDARRYPLAPQMLPGAAARYGSADGWGLQGYSVPAGKVDWAATQTAGHVGAPVADGPARAAGPGLRRRGPQLPVVLYSPGAGEPRTWETTLVQDLASRGYAVVTIDHTYDADEVEFPVGQVIDGEIAQWLQDALRNGTAFATALKILTVRVADTRFVLNELAALDSGHNPDAGHRPIPPGLAGSLDLGRAGMFGVSAGGFTAAQAMYEDPRIRAGIDMDGNTESPLIPGSSHLEPVFDHGLNQPFMFMGDPLTDHNTIPSWKSFWARTRGWHADLTLNGASGENSYKDAVPLIPQIARQLGLPRSFVTGDIGNINPARTVRAEEAYVSAFFDRWLRGHDNHLLDGPSPRYPEFTFVR